jgi:hypothetical protein
MKYRHKSFIVSFLGYLVKLLELQEMVMKENRNIFRRKSLLISRYYLSIRLG